MEEAKDPIDQPGPDPETEKTFEKVEKLTKNLKENIANHENENEKAKIRKSVKDIMDELRARKFSWKRKAILRLHRFSMKCFFGSDLRSQVKLNAKLKDAKEEFQKHFRQYESFLDTSVREGITTGSFKKIREHLKAMMALESDIIYFQERLSSKQEKKAKRNLKSKDESKNKEEEEDSDE